MMVWRTPWKALRFRLERGGRNAVIYEWKNNCFGWPSACGRCLGPRQELQGCSMLGGKYVCHDKSVRSRTRAVSGRNVKTVG